MILASYLDNLLQNLSSGEATAWTFFGLAANACFAGRFILQWIISERKGRSVVPLGFWYLSLLGGVMMLIYAIHVGKLPLVLGAMFTPFIAARNLWLVRNHRRAGDAPDVPLDS
jgi:lipid-A-disaccharide synthase-like uncharacterized protein